MSQIEAVQYPNLPLCDDLKGKSYFVRDCYEEYYDLIVDSLAKAEQHTKIITVTGSPGIGKSIFYIYFFQRFKKENPNTTIVTAYCKNQILRECIVYKPGRVVGKPMEMLPWPEIEDALYLFDGAPEFPPPDVKMITFTSPNPTWYHTIFKFMGASTIFYMPCWKLDELKVANSLLNLKFTDEELDARFNVFGGSARCCLDSAELYDKHLSELEAKIESIKTEKDLGSTLRSSYVRATQYHSLFHLIPDDSCLRFQWTCCSRYVADQICENISNWDEERIVRFIDSLREFRDTALLRGNLYEYNVSQRLKCGTTLRIVSLNAMRNELDLNISQVYCIPCKVRNDKSISGYLKVEHVIYLLQFKVGNVKHYWFQTTGSNPDAEMNTHLVSSKEIAKFINENLRNFKESILAGSILLRLLFVIPEALNNFIRQAVDPIKEVNESDPVTCIEGIGRNYEEQLSIYQIHTVGQLRQQINANRSQFVDSVLKAWDKFDEINSERSRWQFLGNIPQYVTVQEFNVT